MQNSVIKELNTFLEGNYMAIQAYERYIHHIDDSDIKQSLQKIQ
jgi:bacterioferritin